MTSLFIQLDARLRRLPDLALLALGLVIVAGIAAFKLTEGREIPIVDFYLIPVAAVGWLARSRRYGYLAAIVTATMSIAIALAMQPDAPLGAAVAAGAARLILYFIVLSVLAAMRRMQLEQDTEARTDHQTGAANARAFRARAACELERSRRYGHELSFFYLDIDGFKAINDRLGHVEGDQVLLHVSHVMRSNVRSADTVARLGGDEFAILMPETGAVAARALAERIRVDLARIRARDEQSVTCSIGLVTFPPSSLSVVEMVRAGDRLMYEAKDQGKNRIAQVDLAGPMPVPRAS
jgi:diguanylate cyclase (GGDEF)-like protein